MKHQQTEGLSIRVVLTSKIDASSNDVQINIEAAKNYHETMAAAYQQVNNSANPLVAVATREKMVTNKKAFVKPAGVETASASYHVVRPEAKQAGTLVAQGFIDSRCTVFVKQSIPVNRYQKFAKTTDVQGLIYRTSVLRPSGNKEFQMIDSSDLFAFKDAINMESDLGDKVRQDAN